MMAAPQGKLMAEVFWFYAKNDQQLGPVSATELKQLAIARTILPEDLIWREGMDGWAPAARVKGLFADVQEPSIVAPPVGNGPTETMPPATVAAITGAIDKTPPLASLPSGVSANLFSPPAVVGPEARGAVRPQESPLESATGGWAMVDLLWLAQVLLWSICVAVLFVGGLLFTRTLFKAESAMEETAAATVFATFFFAAYLVARAGERVAALVQVYFDRKRKP